MEQEKVYIVGAHSRGRTVAHYLTYLNPQLHIEAYLVNNDEINPDKIEEVPVIRFDEETLLNREIPVYIGTRGVYHEEIIAQLKRIGMLYIVPVDCRLDLDLRNRYMKKYYSEVGKVYCKIDEMEITSKVENLSAAVYVAKSICDSPLKEPYNLMDYEKDIQVGAALTKKRLYNGIFTDCTGEHISERNKQFCELTALYWIWKNAKEDVVGLAHYRRHFILPTDWLERMKSNHVDVILPVPLYVAPSLEENYKSRHDAVDWDNMMQCLKLLDMEEYVVAKEFFAQGLYSPCNMVIMRKEVLDELCQWLFQILFEVVRQGGQKEDNYLNRYPGFLSERLISFFFDKNRDRFKIVYADKNFII